MGNNISYSIVIPVYNGENNLTDLYNRLTLEFRQISDDYEAIFVDDNSTDNSWTLLKKIQGNDKKIKIIHLLRNFGQHSATICGLNYAQGKYIVVMDDDLQNPPEEIPKLIGTINQGFSVVYGRYNEKKHSYIKNLFSQIFQIFLHRILDIPKDVYISNFVIFTSEVAQNAIKIKSTYPQLTAVITKSAPKNKITNVDVIHNERRYGRSNYNFINHLKIAFDLIINYSSLPLKIVGGIGSLISILSISYGLYVFYKSITDPTYGLVGWNSLMVAITFLGGAILMGIGVIGEYLRRILAEVSHGQQYVIDEMY
jgi:glycosyltransferase involved in cell wall biosynthesis